MELEMKITRRHSRSLPGFQIPRSQGRLAVISASVGVKMVNAGMGDETKNEDPRPTCKTEFNREQCTLKVSFPPRRGEKSRVNALGSDEVDDGQPRTLRLGHRDSSSAPGPRSDGLRKQPLCVFSETLCVVVICPARCTKLLCHFSPRAGQMTMLRDTLSCEDNYFVPAWVPPNLSRLRVRRHFLVLLTRSDAARYRVDPSEPCKSKFHIQDAMNSSLSM